MHPAMLFSRLISSLSEDKKKAKGTQKKQLIINVQNNETIVVTRVPKRTKKRSTLMSMRIRRNGDIVVSAPLRLSDKAIKEWVIDAMPWIKERRLQMAQEAQNRANLCYQAGEKHLYLGCEYALVIIEAKQAAPIQLIKETFHIQVKAGSSPETIKRKLYEWYAKEAFRIFHERLMQCLPRVPWVKEVPPLRISRMKTRWGSCSSTNKISMNLHLIKASERMIDYILLHELCHIQEHNHSVRFYQLMDQVLPQWRQIKAELDQMQKVIMNE